MLNAVSSLLSGTISESLKRLVTPANLVPATVFIGLFLAFIFPVLEVAKVPGVAELRKLEPGEAAIVLGTAIILLSYLVGVLNPSILRSLTGESWSDSPVIGRWSADRQQKAVAALRLRADGAADTEKTRLQFEGRTRYRDEKVKDTVTLAPTALGNVLNASAGVIWSRYGFSMTALWPHLSVKLGKDQPIADRISDDESTLNALVNLTGLLAAFGILVLVIRSAYFEWFSAITFSVITFLAAYACYRTTVIAAVRWTDTVEVAIDLYRSELAKALALPVQGDPEADKDVWRAASVAMVWGAPPPTAPPPAPADVTVSVSDNLVALPITSMARDTDEPERTERRLRWDVSYTLVLTAGRAVPAYPVTGFALVRDRRVPWIREAPSATGSIGGSATASIVPEDGGPVVLWRITRVATGDSGAISWKVPVCDITWDHADCEITAQAVPSISGGGRWYRLLLQNTSPTADLQVNVTIEDVRWTAASVVARTEHATLTATNNDHRYAFGAIPIPKGGKVALVIDASKR